MDSMPQGYSPTLGLEISFILRILKIRLGFEEGGGGGLQYLRKLSNFGFF